MTSFLECTKIYPSALFVAGEVDPVIKVYRKAFDNLEINVLQLKGKILISGVGHWVNQERPAEINKLILEFLKSLEKEKGDNSIFA